MYLNTSHEDGDRRYPYFIPDFNEILIGLRESILAITAVG